MTSLLVVLQVPLVNLLSRKIVINNSARPPLLQVVSISCDTRSVYCHKPHHPQITRPAHIDEPLEESRTVPHDSRAKISAEGMG